MVSKYQITELCPHCENEVTMNWDVETFGYQAYCPYCGKRLMLCDECTHTENGPDGGCDYDSDADHCSQQKNVRRLRLHQAVCKEQNCHAMSGWSDTPEEAADAWNRRADNG